MRVLLTGAAGGIGRETVRRLRRAGHDVVALDRDERVESLPRVDSHVVDVTDSGAVERIVSSASLDAVVCCVGSYEMGAIGEQSPEAVETQLETNVLGTHTVVHAALPGLRARGGRVVIVGSLLGRVALPYHGPYAASKHALVGYADALRRECSSISVSLVEPGPVATGMNERAATALEKCEDSPHAAAYRHLRERETGSTGTAPEAVAEAIERALTDERPRACYRVGARARLLPWLRVLLPSSLFDRVVRSGTVGSLSRLVD
jgi:NAD(P)-dependent dehydrogenase (short-subunit alcohol dehydrogenase family)